MRLWSCRYWQTLRIQKPIGPGTEKGVKNHLSERPAGRPAQMVPAPLSPSRALHARFEEARQTPLIPNTRNQPTVIR